MQLCNILNNPLPIRLKCSFNLRLHKLLNLLRRSANECTRLEQGIEVGDDRLEKGGAADALD